MQELLEQLTTDASERPGYDDQCRYAGAASGAAGHQWTLDGRGGATIPIGASPEPTAAETPTKATDIREPAKPAPTAASKPTAGPGETVYTTVAGDNLAVVAKKMYGPEEGNRYGQYPAHLPPQ